MKSMVVMDGAAPLERARQSPVLAGSGKRLRRRGPRSKLALLRRSAPKQHRTLPGTSPGESGDTVSDTSIIRKPQDVSNGKPDIISKCTPKQNVFNSSNLGEVSVYTVNIQCLLARLQELNFQLEMHRPHVVLIQETWLDDTTEAVTIPNYNVVSRRDRKRTANRGGILALQRQDFNGLVHIKDCAAEERSWHFLRLGFDTILLANWYRPGATVHDGFANLYTELAEYWYEISGVFVAGDLNIHHRKWLRYSNDDTTVGADLKTLCEYHGMNQLVREPTRNEYLLDLVCTDIYKTTVKVLPMIADHRSVLAKLPLPAAMERKVAREVWMLAKADWKQLRKELGEFDWSQLHVGSAEDALQYFLQVLWLHLVRHIPRRRIEVTKHSHGWMTDRSKAAIQKKNAAEGTHQFAAASEACAVTLAAERAKYVQQVKEKMANLPRGRKRWWRINRELMRRKANLDSIPTLKDNGQWLSDAKSKADAFARTFASKSQLPDEQIDTPFIGNPEVELTDVVVFRSRHAKRLLKELDENKATGSDMISAAILKRLSDCLGIPFTIVVRRLFHEGCWPSVWKFHVICPIFKRGAAFMPNNYRGIHLTTVLSKVAEKMIGMHFVPFLQRKAFGPNQWAFTPRLGARDLVAMLMMSFILAVCLGKKIGGFLSDITGAFDRVSKEILLGKLHEQGVGEQLLAFLASYLAPRTGKVAVQGEWSEEMIIDNSVFQGTVLGPPLWNAFFGDVRHPAKSTGGREAKFADDLNVFQEFDRLQSVTSVQATLEKCRGNVHRWGKLNRVSFDASKEHLVILHPSQYHGDAFKLLGCMVDTDLRMESCIEQLLSKICPKITAILRTRAYYSVPDLVTQFKTHIWGLIEVNMGAYFHAASYMLAKIDHAQNRFLRALGLSPDQAFLDYNFAPPSLRRNIGILGLLHKRVLGQCHPSFDRLLPWYSTRFTEARGHGHTKQLYGHWVEVSNCQGLFSRSIFGMVDIYNNLPQHVVDASSINCFQKYLIHIARTRCQQGDVAWSSSFCRRACMN